MLVTLNMKLLLPTKFIAAVLFVALACVSQEAYAETDLSPSELYQKVFTSSEVQVSALEGAYARKLYNNSASDSEQIEKQVEEVINRLREQRRDNPQLMKELDSQIESMRADLRRQFGSKVYVTRDQYRTSGGQYRLDRQDLSDTNNYESIDDVASEVIDHTEINLIEIWNGEFTSSRIPGSSTGEVSAKGQFVDRLELRDEAPEMLSPITFGRAFNDSTLIETLEDVGYPTSVISTTSWENEPALKLSVGLPDSVTFYMELIVLPHKNYVVSEGKVRQGGTDRVVEKYGQYVEISEGVWVPQVVDMEAWKLNEHGQPYLSSKLELLAIEAPTTEVKFSESIFDLNQSSNPTRVFDMRGGGDRQLYYPGGDLASIGGRSPLNEMIDSFGTEKDELLLTDHKFHRHEESSVSHASSETLSDNSSKRNEASNAYIRLMAAGIGGFILLALIVLAYRRGVTSSGQS